MRRASLVFVALVLFAACGTTAPQVTETTGAQGSGGITQSGSSGDAADPLSPGTSSQGSTDGATTPRQGGGGVVSADPGTGDGTGSIATPTKCNIPTKGPGWDEKNVYFGAAVQTDAATVGESIGFNAFDFGDQKSFVEAVFADLNASGGVCGRKAVPVYYDVSSVNDTNQEAQAACTKWTQDQRVVSASLVPNINIPNMYACLAEAGIQISTLTGSPSLEASLKPYKPYLVLRNTVAWDHFVSHWVDRLTSMGYFKPWNTSSGAPGSAPVKVAILAQDDPIANEAWKALRAELERRKITVSDFVLWDNPTQMSNYVLQFSSNDVTHLFIDRLAGIFYPSQAQSQNYYARYALTSQNFIQPFLALGPAPQQLRGAMGVGWHPTLDVQQAQDPGGTPGYTSCMKLMQRAGVDVSKRNYKFTATASCDGIGMLKRIVAASGGFTPKHLQAGLLPAARTMPWANLFGAAGRTGESGMLSVTRDLRYDSKCSCVRFTSGNVTIP